MYRLLRQIAKNRDHHRAGAAAPTSRCASLSSDGRGDPEALRALARDPARGRRSCNGCELEIHAANSAYYNLNDSHQICRQPAPRRYAARHGPRVAEHGGSGAAHVRGDARAQACRGDR